MCMLCVGSCMTSVFVCVNVGVCVCNGSQITQQASCVMSVEANILVPWGHSHFLTT